jgi:starch synthase (maltosyl-transferring)
MPTLVATDRTTGNRTTGRAHGLPDSAGRARPVIGGVRPAVDGGRYPAKGTLGEAVTVEADIVADGHDELLCEVRFRHEEDQGWQASPLAPLGNDRWRGEFTVSRCGRHRFVIGATIDRFGTWRRDLSAWAGAGRPLGAQLLAGAELAREAALRATGDDRRQLIALIGALEAADGARPGDALALAERADVGGLMARHRDLRPAATSAEYVVEVERARARFSTWYELFPRSASPEPGRPGTLADVQARLSYVAQLGFDTLYLPPVHPIGHTARKGKDGAAGASPTDPGSPWAIGSDRGGHTAIDPELGTLADFDALVAAAADQGIAVALDLAFQCSPDHPWVGEHPDWFRREPDGSIRPAENPPKRYEDVYPLDFETDDCLVVHTLGSCLCHS